MAVNKRAREQSLLRISRRGTGADQPSRWQLAVQPAGAEGAARWRGPISRLRAPGEGRFRSALRSPPAPAIAASTSRSCFKTQLAQPKPELENLALAAALQP